MEPVLIRYSMTSAKGGRELFVLMLDGKTLELQREAAVEAPPWAVLSFRQCPHCPLDPEQHPICPVAFSLVDLVKRFATLLSHDVLELKVITRERTVIQTTTAQRAISSLMGLLIATSGCPHTDFLKPMARFHLPLASEEETIYRACSMYLLAQYFLSKEGHVADFNLSGLAGYYQKLQKVNRSMSDRLRAASKTDSSVNAMILLDLFAKAMPYAIKESLDELRHLFESYFRTSS